MAGKVTNIVGGKGATVEGLQELRVRLRSLIDLTNPAVSGMSDSRASAILNKARVDLSNHMRQAANIFQAEAQKRMRAANWPKPVIAAVFTYADPTKDKSRTTRGALAGVRKGAPPRKDKSIYREWMARADRSWAAITGGYLRARGKKVLKKGLVSGRIIGMSLASMFEFGTSKMAARPAVRPALKATKSAMLERVAHGYRDVVSYLAEAIK